MIGNYGHKMILRDLLYILHIISDLFFNILKEIKPNKPATKPHICPQKSYGSQIFQ